MFIHDLRYAARQLLRQPGFTAAALLTLALGIGANAAIFSIVDGVLLRPAPVPDLDRLAIVWETDRNTGTTREPASLPDFLDYRTASRRIRGLAAFLAREVNLTPAAGDPARLQALAISDGYFDTLGVGPIAGRTFTPAETRPGGERVVLLGDRLWTSAFNRDPGVLGQTLQLDDLPWTIVGVMPAGGEFGAYQVLGSADYARGFADRGARAAVDLWLPLQAGPDALPRSTHPLFMIGRLDGEPRLAQEELSALAADLERRYPENAARGVFVEPLSQVVFGPSRPALLVLLAAVGLVLLVACANVTNLLLVRGAGRQREIAVRTALGAGRLRLCRQFAIEGLLLAVAAAGIGIAAAAAGLRFLVAVAPADLPRIADAGLDLRVLAVLLVVTVVVGLAVGVIPMLQASTPDLHGALKSGGGHGASAGGQRRRLRAALVVGEFALAVMLVIGAGLLVKSFWRLQQVDPGFAVGGVLKAEYQLPRTRYPVDFARFPDFAEMHAFTHRLLDAVASLPGVDAAAIAGNHPLDPGFTNSFVVVGREAEARTWPEISIRRVTPGYFRTLSVPLAEGRLLGDGDTTAAAPVVVINGAARQRFFGDRNPLGQQLRFWGVTRTIVGVVGNERFQGLTAAPPPAVYAPLDQAPSTNGAGALLVRTGGRPEVLSASIRRTIHQQDPALAVFGLEPLAETAAHSVAERRFTMLVLSILAAVALLLAAVGIHGVLAYAVGQRTREIGIRMALGAEPGRVRRLVLREGVGLALWGSGVGLAGAWVVSRLLDRLLFGVTATDPVVFALVPLLLTLVAVAACYLPARRATLIDPVRALRSE